MSQEIELECYRLIEENDIDVSELPEKIQRKLELLEEVIEEFNECETDTTEEEDCELRMQAMDTGICKDLEPLIEKMKQEEEEENANQQAHQNQMPPQNQNNTNSEAPSWRFWM